MIHWYTSNGVESFRLYAVHKLIPDPQYVIYANKFWQIAMHETTCEARTLIMRSSETKIELCMWKWIQMAQEMI